MIDGATETSSSATATLAAVRARMASLMLAPHAAIAVRVGGFTLRPEQERTLGAILGAVREFGGALVADPPGTGKTVLALAAAGALAAMRARADDAARSEVGIGALVIAPAALRTQWRDAAAHAELAIHFASFESLSRGAAPPRAATVIIDEAHHARTATTRRYARLVESCFGAKVLCLSATPVVNTAADRDALLALFLGVRSASLSPEETARCVMRTVESAERPTVRDIGVIGRGAEVPGLVDAIAALPPPLPLNDGSHATALIVMSLAMAWRSSLAALDAALRRRLQRGEAMRDLLRAGHAPSRAMLRHWVLHDDATQLAMEALLAPTGGHGASDGAVATLAVHLDAVAHIREMVRPHRDADAAARAEAIRALARQHGDRRLVVFARHAQTIRALHTALRASPGVVAIIGSRVLAAAGRWTRDEVLRAIGPRAGPLRSNDARAIHILLATDVVAEGVEMQGVSIVVHADIPWTPARLEQRTGRVTRVGGLQREVLVARLGAPRGARALIRLGSRLRRKADARRGALHDARAQASITSTLESWRGAGDDSASSVAALSSDRDAFIAVVGEPPEWLVGERFGDRWRITSAPGRVARLLRAARGVAFALTPGEIRATERRIVRALERRTASALTSPCGSAADQGAAPTAATSEPSVVRRRIAHVRTRLARILARAPSLARAEIAARQSRLLARLARPLELARERRLDALLRAELDDATFARQLGALITDANPRNEKSRPSHPGRLRCLLILSCASARPAAPAPTSASPGTAAPR